MQVVFTGVLAHASSQPFMGRSALGAVTLAVTGLGLLRRQILPMDRLNVVVSDGGQAAGIVPERAELSLFVRSKHPPRPSRISWGGSRTSCTGRPS